MRVRRIFLVDDHPMFRDGVRARLEATGIYQVCGEAASAEQALELLAVAGADLVITDIRMGASSGIDLLAAQAASCPCLVLSMLDDQAFMRRATSLGACGYVLKDDPGHILLQAVAMVLQGGRYISPALRAPNTECIRERAQLSPREVSVLRLLAQGQSSKSIAENLEMSMRTVESHRLRLRRKLHLEGPSSLVCYAQQYAGLEPERRPTAGR